MTTTQTSTGLEPIDEPQVPEPNRYDSGDVANSLTGFDELAIKKAFGAELEQLMETGSTFLRALAFAVFRHEGQSDKDAYAAVMGMRLGDVNAMFEPDPADDLPGSEAGKDDD